MADTYYWFAYLQKPEDKEVMTTTWPRGLCDVADSCMHCITSLFRLPATAGYLLDEANDMMLSMIQLPASVEGFRV